jgi:hypothetical protein
MAVHTGGHADEVGFLLFVELYKQFFDNVFLNRSAAKPTAHFRLNATVSNSPRGLSSHTCRILRYVGVYEAQRLEGCEFFCW